MNSVGSRNFCLARLLYAHTRTHTSEPYIDISIYIYIYIYIYILGGFPVVLVVKHLPANAGDKRDAGSIPGLGKYPGEGNGNPL